MLTKKRGFGNLVAMSNISTMQEQAQKIVKKLLAEASDAPWGRSWQPSESQLAWFRANVLGGKEDYVKWECPRSGQVYWIAKTCKTVTLIQGNAHDLMHWHDKNTIVFNKLGYRMVANQFGLN